MQALAIFETAHATRYLGTLCKHFGRKVPAGLTGDVGWIELPFGRCDMSSSPTELRLTVSARTAADLDRTRQVITDHLDRFAFREQPELSWQVTGSAQSD